MSHILLWFNILSFNSLCAALLFQFLFWQRRRERWRVYLIWYVALYSFLLISQTFVYFNNYYLESPMEGLDIVLRYLRGVISVGVIVAYPLLVIKLTNRTPDRFKLFLLLMPAALCFLLVAVPFFGEIYVLVVVINIGFNAYLLGLSISAIIGLRIRSPRHEALSFLYLSTCLYSVMVILKIVFTAGFFTSVQTYFSAAIGGIFCLSSAAVLLITGFLTNAGKNSDSNSLPESFIQSYGISKREADVVGMLISGATNREIAARLFISARTVEAHLYNLYRKCNCRNKIELINKIQSFHP